MTGANGVAIGERARCRPLSDMQGRVLQHLPDGKLNNVDLRSGFMLGGQPIVLVTASDRTHKSI